MKTDNLTAEQAMALTLDNGVVVAGAGAGKTRTLIAKIIADQSAGTSPDRQIVVTFTNAAANEMEERLKVAGGKNPRHLGTLHSLAVRSVMRAWGGTLEVIDDKKFDALIRATCKRTRINAPTSAVRGWILDKPKAGNGKLLVAAVLSAMKAERLIHPDVMLAVYADIAKADHPEGLVVYVDEAQDGSAVDFAIYASLTKNGRLILFGDPRQAIYGFRGADPELFVGMIRAFGPKNVVELTANFRSGGAVIDVANVIAGRIGLDVQPMTAGGKGWSGSAFFRDHFSATEIEVLELKVLIRSAMDQGGSIAILSRYNAVANAAAGLLRAERYQVEQPGREREEDPALVNLKALKEVPDNWPRALSTLGVSFELQDRLIAGLSRVTEVIQIAPMVDEILQTPTDVSKIWVSTVHGAKGLEWDHVHLIGADHLSFDPKDPEDVRLAYVAATRAKTTFTWSSARNRIADRRVDDLKPSPIFEP